ncbi:MAG: hypothetical protein L6R36_004437 [Xanthoria steineri]|nr:MAG: hypothetical protein L6R36_004437 [Xanthoria steineri]
MIRAIFFSIFDVHQGPKVLHQVPADSIAPSTGSSQIPLFHFPSVSSYIIPRPEYCSKLITFATPLHRVLCNPVCLHSSTYPRNAYTFSIALVLDASTPFASYATVTLKLASLLQTLEEQSRFLSRDASPPNTGKIYALCEILLEDLNNYSESMIPIDDSNTLNIKLFPTYPPPPPLHPHHVPLSTVRLESLTDPNWDLTMLRVLPHIDGVNSVKQISLLADADYKLVRKAIEHLLYYGCLLLLDIFSFGASYASTAELASLVEDTDMQRECAAYVALPSIQGNSKASQSDPVSGFQLVELYLKLRQGQTVKSFYIENVEVVDRIDVRRFITFGVIKGFLYRVHRYAIATSHTSRRKREHKSKSRQKANVSTAAENQADGTEAEPHLLELEKFLDGTHCFDEICTEMMISERELMSRLKAFGDVQIICR